MHIYIYMHCNTVGKGCSAKCSVEELSSSVHCHIGVSPGELWVVTHPQILGWGRGVSMKYYYIL